MITRKSAPWPRNLATRLLFALAGNRLKRSSSRPGSSPSLRGGTSHSWLKRFRRILIRWEKKPDNYWALQHLSCPLITFRCAWT